MRLCMAAISPYYITGTPTVDAQIGLNADLTGLLLDDFNISAERDEVVHQNFAAHEAVFIDRTPKYSVSISARVLARTTGITNQHPGTSLARSTFSQFRSGVNHGFDTGEGWWKCGAVTHGQPRGDLDPVTFAMKLVSFTVNSSGTLAASNPS